jgi:hypothetical protein
MSEELYHFSEDPGINLFVPRPVAVPAHRGPGREWLNGPLVWAIDEWHSPMYLFPRDCPRVLIWPTSLTSTEDRERWWGPRGARMMAHIERDWFDRMCATDVYRYALPSGAFESLGDVGMYVARQAVQPLRVQPVGNLLQALETAVVDLVVMQSLQPLSDVWESTMHASGIRLRNASDWPWGTGSQRSRKEE